MTAGGCVSGIVTIVISAGATVTAASVLASTKHVRNVLSRRQERAQPLRILSTVEQRATSWSLALRQPFVPPDSMPSDALEAHAYVKAQGGVDSGRTRIELHVKGASKEPVTIINIRVRVLHKAPPISRCIVFSPSAGTLPTITLRIDLDESPPQAREFNINAPKKRQRLAWTNKMQPPAPFFDSNRITVAYGEIVELVIFAFSKTSYQKWTLELEAIVGDKHRYIRLPAETAHEFETSGIPDSGFDESWMWDWTVSEFKQHRAGISH